MIFNDVLEIKNGKNQKAVENPEGKYPIYGSGGVMGYADDYICEAQTVVVGRKGSINNPLFVEEPFWNVDTAFGLCAKREVLLPRYLYYFCKKFDFERLNKAVTIPSLTKSDLLKIEIELPDLTIQQGVVHKLLKIERIIDFRKQEIEKLDTLIKARFLEMFDSADDVKIFKLNDVCEEITAGGDRPKDTSEIRTEEYPYPVFANAATKEGLLCFSREYKIEKPCVTIAARGCTVGFTAVRNERFTPVVRLISLVPNQYIIPIYLKYYIDIKMCIEGNGAAQPQLTIPMIKSMEIMVPSMELQNQFASFVKQVDKSKLMKNTKNLHIIQNYQNLKQ